MFFTLGIWHSPMKFRLVNGRLKCRRLDNTTILWYYVLLLLIACMHSSSPAPLVIYIYICMYIYIHIHAYIYIYIYIYIFITFLQQKLPYTCNWAHGWYKVLEGRYSIALYRCNLIIGNFIDIGGDIEYFGGLYRKYNWNSLHPYRPGQGTNKKTPWKKLCHIAMATFVHVVIYQSKCEIRIRSNHSS